MMTDTSPAVLERMLAHRSVRRFTSDPVSPEHIERALRAAQMASSSSNVQGYSILRVTDRDEREILAKLTGGQPQVAEAGAFFVVSADQRTHRLVAEREGRPLASNLESFLVDVIDASLFAQNLALAFEALGYGICFIGGLRTRLAEVDRLLAIPDDVFPLFGLCVGVPAESPALRPRLPLGAIYHEGRYGGREQLAEHIAAYDEESARYYAERGAPGRNWSGGVSRKLAEPRRRELAEYYRSKGARLE